MTIITFIFILLIAFSFGWKEVAYSFFDIHVGNVVKLRWFGIGMLLSMGLGMYILSVMDTRLYTISCQDVFILVSAMMVTISLLWMIQRHYSCVTAFFGAMLALQMVRDELSSSLLISVLLSLLAAPCLSVALTLLLRKVLRRRLQVPEKHLMMKFWWAKCALYLGILVCGVALTLNYSLLVGVLFNGAGLLTGSKWVVAVLVLGTCCVCLLPVSILVYRRRHNGKLSNTLASIYAQTVIMLLCNIVLPAFSSLLVPTLISANLLKECNTIGMERGKEIKRLVNVLTIGIVTPLLAFVVTLILVQCIYSEILTMSLLSLILLTAVLVRLYFMQVGKQRFANRKLSHELQYKSEINQQLNRLDVAAVTSQFNTLSTAMDFKQKELINLSLYINQQSEFMKQMESKLAKIASSCTDKNTSKELRSLLSDMQQGLRSDKEVDSLYQEVEEKHRDFVSRLQMRCPSLSPRERRLAILLRLGLSSKEIASMMNLESKSVEMNRYRLRKKLKLDRSENIVHLLQMI